MPLQAGDPSVIYRAAAGALTALPRGALPPGHRLLDEGPAVGTALDDRVNDTGHLGGDRRERLAPEVGVAPVAGDIALELGPEAVLPLPDRPLACHPERPPQPGVAVLGQLGLAAELAGLLGGEVEPAELQKLAMLPEPA